MMELNSIFEQLFITIACYLIFNFIMYLTSLIAEWYRRLLNHFQPADNTHIYSNNNNIVAFDIMGPVILVALPERGLYMQSLLNAISRTFEIRGVPIPTFGTEEVEIEVIYVSAPDQIPSNAYNPLQFVMIALERSELFLHHSQVMNLRSSNRIGPENMMSLRIHRHFLVVDDQ